MVAYAYAYPIPDILSDEQASPLLCAGIIGYRALRRAAAPPGGRLGIYGFGASAHITAQVAIARGAEMHVLTRDPDARALARALGVASVAGAYDAPPVRLDSAIVFAPVGDLVPPALTAFERGGTLAVAALRCSGCGGSDQASRGQSVRASGTSTARAGMHHSQFPKPTSISST